MEDQVYNGINDYLRYVRRWVKPLRHAADRELDQASTARRSGTSGWPTATGARSSARPGRDAVHARPGGFSVAAYDSAIRAAGRLRLQPRLRPLLPATSPSGAPTRSSARATSTSDVPRQGSLPLGGRAADPHAQPHDLPAAAGRTPRGGRAVVVDVTRPARGRRRRRAGRADRQRASTGTSSRALTFKRNGGRLSVRLRRPRPLRAGSPRSWSTPTRRAFGFSARRFDWNYLTDTRAVPGPGAARALRLLRAGRQGGDDLVDRAFEVEAEAVEVGHRVVVADQAEVDLCRCRT